MVGRSLHLRVGESHEFNDFIDLIELIDLPTLGRKFTCCNGDRRSMNRIDRFLLSEGLMIIGLMLVRKLVLRISLTIVQFG